MGNFEICLSVLPGVKLDWGSIQSLTNLIFEDVPFRFSPTLLLELAVFFMRALREKMLSLIQ